MKNIMDKDNYLCTGCSICNAVCPVNAIEMNLSEGGFQAPIIDELKCIECGLCIKLCYKFSLIEQKEPSVLYCLAAQNKDSEMLMQSSSGGVAAILEKKLFEQGYNVIGTIYNSTKACAEGFIAKHENDLNKFRGSKYFQSDMSSAFKELVKKSSNGEKYAIFGTPCQIYAIHQYSEMKGIRENFFLVDLFCHGCASVNLWKKYLHYAMEKYKTNDFEKIEFRSKAKGWHRFKFAFSLKNGAKRIPTGMDLFYQVFFSLNAHCDACYECKLRSSLNYCDLRLGDFWGSEYDEDVKGVSAIVVMTTKGNSLIEDIRDQLICKEHSLQDVLPGQSYGKKLEYDVELHKDIVSLLRSDCSILTIAKAIRNRQSSKDKILAVVKVLLDLLPAKWVGKFRKIYHIRRT